MIALNCFTTSLICVPQPFQQNKIKTKSNTTIPAPTIIAELKSTQQYTMYKQCWTGNAVLSLPLSSSNITIVFMYKNFRFSLISCYILICLTCEPNKICIWWCLCARSISCSIRNHIKWLRVIAFKIYTDCVVLFAKINPFIRKKLRRENHAGNEWEKCMVNVEEMVTYTHKKNHKTSIQFTNTQIAKQHYFFLIRFEMKTQRNNRRK